MFMAFIDETEVLCLYCLHKKKEKKKENSFVGLWAGGEICGQDLKSQIGPGSVSLNANLGFKSQ